MKRKAFMIVILVALTVAFLFGGVSLASELMTMTLSSEEANPGGRVKLTVSLADVKEDIDEIRFHLAYDPWVLTYVSAMFDESANGMMFPLANDHWNWLEISSGRLDSPISADCTLVDIWFEVSEEAAGDTSVSVSDIFLSSDSTISGAVADEEIVYMIEIGTDRAAVCVHENAYLTQHMTYVECVASDRNTHTIVRDSKDKYYCPDCGEKWEQDESVETETGPHIWIDGYCDDCDKKNTCEHIDRYFEYESVGWETCSDNGDGTHAGSRIRHKSYVCGDCGMEWYGKNETVTAIEPHVWRGGVCKDCGAVNGCVHENLRVNTLPGYEYDCTDNGDGTHTGTAEPVNTYFCPDCREWWSEKGEFEIVVRAHEWIDGECCFCNAKNSCTHEKRSVQYDGFMIRWARDTGKGEHTGAKYKYVEYLCPDCGEKKYEESYIGRVTEPHIWENGECLYCSAKEAVSR